MLFEYEAELLNEEYAADATFRVQLPSDGIDAFMEAVTSLTNGKSLIAVLDQDS
jgi:hypothetical protein